MSEIQVRNAPAYAVVAGPHQLDVRNVPVYAVVQEPPRAGVRKVMTYVLSEVPPEASVRKVVAYVLSSATINPYVRLAGMAAIKAAVLKEQGVDLDAQHVEIGVPEVQSGNYKTKLVLTAGELANYGGTFTLNYNRFGLDEAFYGANFSNVPAGGSTVHSRLAAINSTYNLTLQTTDVVDGPASDAGFRLEVASGSYLFVPGTFLVFGNPA